MTKQLLEPYQSELISERFLLRVLILFLVSFFSFATILVVKILQMRPKIELMNEFRVCHEKYYPENLLKQKGWLEMKLRAKGKERFLSYNFKKGDYRTFDLSIEHDWDYREYLEDLDELSTRWMSEHSTRSFDQFVEYDAYLRKHYNDID